MGWSRGVFGGFGSFRKVLEVNLSTLGYVLYRSRCVGVGREVRYLDFCVYRLIDIFVVFF